MAKKEVMTTTWLTTLREEVVSIIEPMIGTNGHN